MIAAHDEDTDIGITETAQLVSEKEARVEVLKLAIEDVAGDDEKIYVTINGKVYNVLERAACCFAHFLGRSPLVLLEASQRAVEVQVGAVKETHSILLKSMTVSHYATTMLSL
ncbi:hypothetical protein GALL_457310 [mine drainage metagenome]|uniref:Uncharacterized protein n=1 Tax=mine drainage metagenome TaxID=410659 RepID=A0A1J5PNC3_9ZZZZ